jgi:hypothetical protein
MGKKKESLAPSLEDVFGGLTGKFERMRKALLEEDDHLDTGEADAEAEEAEEAKGDGEFDFAINKMADAFYALGRAAERSDVLLGDDDDSDEDDEVLDPEDPYRED